MQNALVTKLQTELPAWYFKEYVSGIVSCFPPNGITHENWKELENRGLTINGINGVFYTVEVKN